MTGTATIDPAVLQAAAAIIKCIGHPLRLRLLEALEGGEQTVQALQAACGLTQAMVSHQLGILRGRGIVAARRDGAFVRYHIVEPKVFRILHCIRECSVAGHVPGRSD